MSEVCRDKVQCGTLEQSVSPCGAGYTGSVQCERPTTLPVTGSGSFYGYVIFGIIVVLMAYIVVKVRSALRCPDCQQPLDYRFDGDGYCHACDEYKHKR